MPQSSLQNVLRYARRMAEAGHGSPSTDADLLNHFSIHNDDGSFALLVERHGSMVWGVCRRVLDVVQDAEDCFQAAFLVLARKAHTLQKNESLGAWLHRVAYRLALRSQAITARRRTEEGRAAAMNPVAREREESWKELRVVLDQELEHLPQIYRVPLVLCYLQGKSNAQAAKELGWPLGTVKGRLTRGRELLRKRLEKRGLTLTVVALAALLTEQAAKAAVPGILLMSTTRAATAFAMGQAIAASGRVLTLANEILRAATMGTLIKSAFVMIALSLAVGEGALLADPARVKEMDSGKSCIQVADVRSRPEHPEKPITPPERLDLSGDPLPPDAICRLGSTRFRHGFPIRSLRASPDGKAIVSESYDGVRIWDLQSGKQLQAHAWETDKLKWWLSWATSISPDGKKIVVANEKGIDSYDVTTGAKLATIGTRKYEKAFVSPNGRYLAALPSIRGGSVELFEVHNGKTVWTSGRYEHAMSLACFTGDGKTLVVGGWGIYDIPSASGNWLHILDVESGKERFAIDLGRASASDIAVSPNGMYLSSICDIHLHGHSCVANEIRIWNLATGKEKLRIEPPLQTDKADAERRFSAMLYPPDGKTLLTAGNCDEVVHWDLVSGKEQRRLGNKLANATVLALTPDGKTLIAATKQSIQVLDFTSGRTASDPSVNAMATAISPDGATIATGGTFDYRESSGTFWDANTGKELRRFVISNGFMRGLAMNGKTAIVQHGAVLHLRDLETQTDKPLIPNVAGGMPNVVTVSPSGGHIAIGDAKELIEVIDAQTGATIHTFSDAGRGVRHLRFTSDEKQLFAFSPDQTVRIWDLSNGKKIAQYMLTKIPDNRPKVMSTLGLPQGSSDFPSFAVALSLDGKMIASCDCREYILLRNAADGRNSRRVDVGEVRPNIMAFSPDSKLLVWATMDDPMIHLLDVASGKEVKQLSGHRGVVLSFTFSPDGQRLVSSNSDGTSLVWDFKRIVKELD